MPELREGVRQIVVPVIIQNYVRDDLVESLGIHGLEAGPLSPELPIGNNGWGNGDTQLFLVSKDTVGIVGSEDGGGNTSKPANEVEVVLIGSRTAKEAARGKFGRDNINDQVADVGNVGFRSMEETVLGFFRDLVLIDLEETTIGGDLFVVEGFELGSFRSERDTLKSSLT